MTIMNYDWNVKKNLNLCLTWIYYANKNLSILDTVYIFSEKKLHEKIYQKLENTNCIFKSVICPSAEETSKIHFNPHHSLPIHNNNFWYKLYVTCKTNFPFLFVDCDAFILDDISELQEIFSNTRNSVFFIDHEPDIPEQTIMFPPFINSGVYIMNDPMHKIYNFDKIFAYAKSIGFFPVFENGINIPGTDQAIIKSYLDHLNYNYRHPKFDNKYNASSCAVDKSRKRNYKIIHYWGDQKNSIEFIL